MKQKGKNKGKERVSQVLQEYMAMLYIIWIFVFFTLYYRNNYIDIMRAKRELYLWGTLVFLVVTGCVEICGRFAEREGRGKKTRQETIFLLLTLSCVFVWCIGAAASGHAADAFIGKTGRRLGVIFFCCGAFMMLFLAKYLKWNAMLTWSVLLGSTAVFLLQIMDEWKIDILHMKDDLADYHHLIFSSTIGNTNFNAAFDVGILSLELVFFLLCKEKISEIVYGLALFIGFMGAFCSRSDSAFLGLAGAAVVLLWYVSARPEKWKKLWWEGCLFFLASCVVSLLYACFQERAYPVDGVVKILLSVPVLIAEGSLAAGCGFLVYRGKQRKKNRSVKPPKHICIAAGIVGVAGILCFFLANITEGEGILSILRIDDSWGSTRGYVWKRCMKLFYAYPLFQKLFGCGINCLSFLLKENYGEEMKVVMNGAYFVDAHSEYLQVLMTTGIAGAIGFFGLLALTLKESLQKLKEKEEMLFALVGIAAFLAQGAVNNLQISTLPLFFAQLGIYRSFLRNAASEE